MFNLRELLSNGPECRVDLSVMLLHHNCYSDDAVRVPQGLAQVGKQLRVEPHELDLGRKEPSCHTVLGSPAGIATVQAAAATAAAASTL